MGGVLGRFFEWSWRRYRRHVMAAYLVASVVLLLGGIGFPSLYVVSLIYGLTLWEAIAFGAVVFGSMIAAILATPPTMRRTWAPLVAWGRGDRSDPVAAWESALAFPQAGAVRSILLFLPLGHLVVVPVLVGFSETNLLGVVTLEVGIGIIEGVCVLVAGIGLRLFFAPLLEEVAPLVQHQPLSDLHEWSLRARFRFSILLSCCSAGMAGGAAARAIEGEEGALAIALASGAAIGVYAVILNNVGILGPTFRPLFALLEATRRVQAGDYTESLAVTSADEFGHLVSSFNEMQAGLGERETLQVAFGSYVDPTLAQRVLEQGDSIFTGEDVDVTVFFADVQGFTNYAERTTAQAAVARLNRLFEIVVPIIRDEGGHANHFPGDGVLAVFGTPTPLPGHADRAVAAALEVQRQVRAEFGRGLRVCIGISTGTVIAGTIGGGGKLQFTVIGDTVNVASRIEALTRETGDPILLTQATLDALSQRPRGLRARGEVDVRGKARGVTVYGLRA